MVKDLPPAITGEGNFFDRVAVKLRDIIPIHVRDVLFEIRTEICVSAASEVCVSGEEISFTPTPCFGYFDMFMADAVPTDSIGHYVSGLATVTP